MYHTDFIMELSSPSPTPGGGGAAASVGVHMTALGIMVANLTIGKKKYADYEVEIMDAKEKLILFRQKFIDFIEEDAKAFQPLASAYRLPQNTSCEIEYREKIMEEALYQASIVPLQMMKTVLETIPYLELLAKKGNRLAISDIGVALSFAQATLEGASYNIFINIGMMKDKKQAEELRIKAKGMFRELREWKERITDIIKEVIGEDIGI